MYWVYLNGYQKRCRPGLGGALGGGAPPLVVYAHKQLAKLMYVKCYQLDIYNWQKLMYVEKARLKLPLGPSEGVGRAPRKKCASTPIYYTTGDPGALQPDSG